MNPQTMRYSRKKILQDVALLMVLGWLPFFWFGNEYLVTGADANFPLDHAKWLLSRLFVWNNQFNTGVEAAINPTTLFFHSIQAFFHWLGARLSQAQRLSFVFWFTLQALSMYFLVAVIQRQSRPSRLERWISVITYAFAPIMFNVWEVAKAAELSALVGMPFVLGLCILATQQRLWLWAAAVIALASPLFSEAGAGPPVFLIPVFVVTLWSLFHILLGTASSARLAETKALVRFFAVLAVLYLLTNAYWLFPFLHEIHSKILRNPTGGLETFNLSNWLQGISTHTSLLNVSRFQGAWDWYYGFRGEDYISYAQTFLRHPIFLLLSICLPIMAYGTLALRRNRWVVFFATLAFGMTLFGAGAHPPFGGVYLWLTEHVPFFTMFRSPYYKFGLALALAYAYLVGVFTGELVNRLETWMSERRGSLRPWMNQVRWSRLAAGGVFCAILGYGYPMLTGEVVYQHAQMPSLKLKIPPYIFEAGRWLDQTGSDGRVLSLPRDHIDNYQWGYGSILHIMNLVTLRPVLYSREFASGFESALKVRETYYESLYRRQTPFTRKILSLLGSDLILLRNDSWYDLYTDAPSPAAIRTLLAEQEGLRLERRLGAWEFYNVDHPLPKVRLATSVSLVKGGQGRALVPLTYTDLLDAGRATLFTEDIPTQETLRRLMKIPSLVNTFVLFNAQAIDFAMDLTDPASIRPITAEAFDLKLDLPTAGNYQILLKRREDPYAAQPVALTSNAVIVDRRTLLPVPQGSGDGPFQNGRWFELERLFLPRGSHTFALAVADTSLEALAVVPADRWDQTLQEIGAWLKAPQGPEVLLLYPTDYMQTQIRPPEPNDPATVRIERLQNFYSNPPPLDLDPSWMWLQIMEKNILVHNDSSRPVRATLAFDVLSLGEDRDLRIQMGLKDLSVDMVPTNQLVRTIARDIEFLPGKNTLRLWSPYSSSYVPGEKWEEAPQGRSFAIRNIRLGQVDFMDDIRIPVEGMYRLFLYPYPAAQELYSELSKHSEQEVALGGSSAKLLLRRDLRSRCLWYESEPLWLSAGSMSVRFRQLHGENYYFFLRRIDRPHPVEILPSSYDRQNLVKYRFHAPPIEKPTLLVFSETHSPHWWTAFETASSPTSPTGWKRWILSDARKVLAGRLPEKNHLLVDGYANGWILEESPEFNQTILLIYMPQMLLELGGIISGLTLLLCAAVAVLKRPRGRRP